MNPPSRRSSNRGDLCATHHLLDNLRLQQLFADLLEPLHAKAIAMLMTVDELPVRQVCFSQFVDVWLVQIIGSNPGSQRTRQAQKAMRSCIGQLREIFDIFDPNNDGSITEDELVAVLNSLGSTEEVRRALAADWQHNRSFSSHFLIRVQSGSTDRHRQVVT